MKERPLIIDGEVQTGAPRKAFQDISSVWYQQKQVKEWMAHAFNNSSTGIDFSSLETKKAVLAMALSELGGGGGSGSSKKRSRTPDDEADNDEGMLSVIQEFKFAGKFIREDKDRALRLYDAYIVSGLTDVKTRRRTNNLLRNSFFGQWR